MVCYRIFEYPRRIILYTYWIFLENSSFIQTFRYQISDLVVKISDEISTKSKETLVTDVYVNIFVLLPNLNYLELDTNDNYPFSRSMLNDFSSPVCCSSTIVNINIKMHNFDDCLYFVRWCHHLCTISFCHCYDVIIYIFSFSSVHHCHDVMYMYSIYISFVLLSYVSAYLSSSICMFRYILSPSLVSLYWSCMFSRIF